MTYRVRVTPHAESQILEAGHWWVEHREKAPELFEAELLQAYEKIASAPSIVGKPVPDADIPGVLRVLMPKTKTHIYYVIDETVPEVVVITVWGAKKEHGPNFSRVGLR